MKTNITRSIGETVVHKNGKIESILVLERDVELRRSIALSLEQNGLQVFEAGDDAQAFEVLEREALALLVIDRDSALRCEQVIKAFRKKSRRSSRRVLLITMERLEDVWRQRFRPDAVIYKPFDIRYLYRRIARLMA